MRCIGKKLTPGVLFILLALGLNNGYCLNMVDFHFNKNDERLAKKRIGIEVTNARMNEHYFENEIGENVFNNTKNKDTIISVIANDVIEFNLRYVLDDNFKRSTVSIRIDSATTGIANLQELDAIYVVCSIGIDDESGELTLIVESAESL